MSSATTTSGPLEPQGQRASKKLTEQIVLSSAPNLPVPGMQNNNHNADNTGETLVVRHCALDSGTLTQDTELGKLLAGTTTL